LGIAHLAGSTRDVGAADHGESVAAGLRKRRLCASWLNIVAVALAQRQGQSDYDYSERDKLDQISRPFSVGISITEEVRNANPQRVGSFHVHITFP